MSGNLPLRRGAATTGVHRLRHLPPVQPTRGGRMPTTKKKQADGDGVLMAAPEGLSRGSSGDDVKAVQNYLTRFGYLAPPASDGDGRAEELDLRAITEAGEYDDATEEAVRLFQQMAGLEVTGELDEPTREKMNQPRCGNPDITPLTNPNIASMVEPELAPFVATGGRGPTTALTYAIQETGIDLPAG